MFRSPFSRPLGLVLVVALATLPGSILHASSADSPSRRIGDDPRVTDALRLLDVWLESERARLRIPGISVAIVHDQELLWAAGLGWADREARRAAQPDTLYSICSISKLFTSVALMRLRDEGKVALDDQVGDLLPWFELDSRFDDALPITVEAILSHSAGLPRESAHPYWTAPDFPFPTREEIIAGLAEQEALYPASRYYQYSNLGLTLAGEIVREVSGRPFAEYVTEEVLEPLGLESTTPSLPEEERGKRLAQGYGPWPREGDRVEMPFFQAKGIAPAAGFSSSALDLARFASWQFRLLREGGREILRASTLRDMQRVHWIDHDWSDARGLGFGVWRRNGTTFVGHGGHCPGFRTQLSLSPADRIAVVLMSNAMSIDAERFTARAWEVVAPAVSAALESPDEGTETDPELLRFTGLYRSAWGEAAVLPWRGGLALLDLPSDDPNASLARLSRVDGPVFRRVRGDDTLAEEIVFVSDDDGRVVRLLQHGNSAEKVD